MSDRVLLEDTRNPVQKHKNIHRWAEANGVKIIRSKLLVGDYTLPRAMAVCVDTKASLQEVYSNLVQDHERFRAECELAQDAGIRLVILVEGEAWAHSVDDVARWRNKRREDWFRLHAAHQAGRLLKLRIPKAPPIDSERLAQMMRTMAERHGCEWKFCGKDDTGSVIWELLNQTGVYS